MKVDYTRPAYGTAGTYGVDSSTSRPSAQVSTGASSSDTVSMSGDLGLAERALSAANKTPDIRPEAVERGRALIAKPVDVEQLSDAMVYRLLESWKTE